MPSIPATAVDFETNAPDEVTAGKKIIAKIKTTPFTSTDTITFTSSSTSYATVRKIDNRTVEITGVAAGSATITATNGTVSDTLSVTVNAAS